MRPICPGKLENYIVIALFRGQGDYFFEIITTAKRQMQVGIQLTNS